MMDKGKDLEAYTNDYLNELDKGLDFMEPRHLAEDLLTYKLFADGAHGDYIHSKAHRSDLTVWLANLSYGQLEALYEANKHVIGESNTLNPMVDILLGEDDEEIDSLEDILDEINGCDDCDYDDWEEL
jgi:hypothetical protein